MLKLENIAKDAQLTGLLPNEVVRVISIDELGPDARKVVYETTSGDFAGQTIFRTDEHKLALATAGRAWAFDADPGAFKLGLEAYRISLAHLFDPMMAIHTSNVEPLPHQISAVYEAMLPRQPLRFVLADDPGAGKTIMAGLLIRELMMRADAKRVLIVSPGSLTEQWQDELTEKFGLRFELFSREKQQQCHSRNYFGEQDQLFVRLDQLSRNDEFKELLSQTEWDLVVVDEAHKMSASYYGQKLNETGRFRLGKLLGRLTRHFLLMTATPHNGKEADFQLFMSLLDSDRFYGKFREGVHKVDVSDMMRRMVKEDLLKFDGRPLFPERRAYTVTYPLSNQEVLLYDKVTDYVREEMNRADNLDEASEGLNAEEYEAFAEQVVDQATAAATIPELQAEIAILQCLEEDAAQVVRSGKDKKWEEFSALLQNTPEMRTADGRQRKLIVFTEHRDTLSYLETRIRGLLGRDEAVVTIHGGVNRDLRRQIQEEFRQNPDVQVLLATDAAGEGVNLQNANLMVNYDLPWNPNRMEQRFGRIHRIGQREVCHLWNLVAHETREGQVFQRLLEKLDVEREALGGRVFNVLGEAFKDVSLKDLLVEAIRYGERPDVKLRMEQVIDAALETGHLKELMARNALVDNHMNLKDLYAVREEMEKAEARNLQPFFIQAFFKEAFRSLGGELRDREAGRFEVRHVPADILECDRVIGESRKPVLKKYERICFEKEQVDVYGKPPADLVHPGHPLMAVVTDLIFTGHRSLLRQGAVLVDPSDDGLKPRVVFMIDHSVREAVSDEPRDVSRRLQFVSLDENGQAHFAGYAPHLDLRPMDAHERGLVAEVVEADWITLDLETRALSHAATALVPEHTQEIAGRRKTQADKQLAAVNERLVKEIQHWSNRAIKLDMEVKAGKQPRIQPDNARRRVEELSARLEQRTAELKAMGAVASGTPKIVGGALVIPQGLLEQRSGSAQFTADAQARARVERIAMQAVTDAEQALGHRIKDVSADKCGWDITAFIDQSDNGLPLERHIEVKGRAKGQDTITVTRNEISYALNQRDKFILAIVIVDGDAYDGPYYLRNPFTQEPDWADASKNLSLPKLLERAQSPAALACP